MSNWERLKEEINNLPVFDVKTMLLNVGFDRASLGLPELPESSNITEREMVFTVIDGERFINESGLEFSDISSEVNREYTFPNGKTLLIEKPIALHVSKSGGHRVITEDNVCYYVQPREGWSIKWNVKEGAPKIVK